MENCIFCKIASGAVPVEKVYEDEHILAFPDANPHSKGHTLVIPKMHYANLLAMPESLQQKLIVATTHVAELIKKQYAGEDMNITTNIGSKAGQVVFHAHIHIIPRY